VYKAEAPASHLPAAQPGIKITSRAFGKDRRFPITNLFGGIITE